ncbi:MAPEG family protein [Pseudolysobacter antarcticus]|uniref:MAPEG family protein n=1 Tax=Pseudolysobacter antarcticus TaxID=2511995 RepID=A0A411HML8_9GAMM|nr:MAPEG family protein [Pseudolysobacter antarcticus]QBB71716.1 MAPEG family protein [Pseudolysobacter antarcticus]
MHYVELVALLALLQFLIFIVLVGRARGRYGIKAPATSGHEIFDRYFRVQQNTQENLLMFLPALWIAAAYWNPLWVAAVGAIYLVGRVWYCVGYVRDPRSRAMGYLLTAIPIVVLLLAALYGVVRTMI